MAAVVVEAEAEAVGPASLLITFTAECGLAMRVEKEIGDAILSTSHRLRNTETRKRSARGERRERQDHCENENKEGFLQ